VVKVGEGFCTTKLHEELCFKDNVPKKGQGDEDVAVTVHGPMITWKLWDTGGAAEKSASPPCDAVIMQRPALM